MSAGLLVVLMLGGAIGLGLLVASILNWAFPVAPREYNCSELRGWLSGTSVNPSVPTVPRPEHPDKPGRVES